MNQVWRDRGQWLAGNLLVATACGLSARAVQVLFAAINERFILFWPPVGLALGAALLFGPRLLWGAFLGVLLNGIWYGVTPGIATGIAAGDLLEVLVAYALLRRSGTFDQTFARGQDYLLLIGITVLAAALGATVGVGAGTFAGRIPWSVVPRAWLRWWMGDQLGILLVVPALLVWWQEPRGWLGRRGMEFLVFLGVAWLAGGVILMGWGGPTFSVTTQTYLLFPFIAWAAVRHGRHGVTLLLLMVMVQALAGAAWGTGLFAQDKIQTHLTNFWFFMVSLAAVGITLASVIRERERAEAAAHRETSFKNQVLEGVPAGLLVFSAEGDIVFANHRAGAILGLTDEELRKRTSRDPSWRLVDPDLTPLPKEAYPVNRVLATGAPVWNQEVGLPGREGEPLRWLLVNTFPEVRPDGGVDGVVAMFLDITDRRLQQEEHRRLEGILQHTQKMESLGTLAGGVAHDMNNVLGGIMMVGSTLQVMLEDQPDFKAPLDTLRAASERGRDLVRKLVEFSRRDLEAPRPVDLNELVVQEVDILRHTTRNKVVLQTDLAPGLPWVLGEPSALASVVMNLSVNALDAIEAVGGGGTLAFRTRVLEDGQVELAVTDTGAGMSPEVLARAFDPFFTTKPVGKGTGLGLAMLHTTLKAHGGSVAVDSVPGRGTTFFLRFPPLAEPPGPVAERVPAVDATLAGASVGRVLLVDDDALIREATPALLQVLGLDVETFSHGEACLARLQAGRPADLVILDHNMPGLTGLETLHRLRMAGHGLPVVLSSGYLDEAQEQAARALSRVWLLRKPYQLTDLREVLAQALGAQDLERPR